MGAREATEKERGELVSALMEEISTECDFHEVLGFLDTATIIEPPRFGWKQAVLIFTESSPAIYVMVWADKHALGFWHLPESKWVLSKEVGNA